MGKPRVYFVDGIAIEPDYVCLIAYLHELDEQHAEGARIYTLNKGKWGASESDHHLVSVAYIIINGLRTYFFIGKRGEMQVIDKNGRRKGKSISSAGTGGKRLGYLSQIKTIGGELYVCGANRQVYRWENNKNGKWIALHEQILDHPEDGITYAFNSIDGAGADNIYAVGRKGAIYHYDGKKWTAIKSPTKFHLERVLCANDGSVYACGNDGTLVRGEGKSWKVLAASKEDQNFWGLAEYRNEIYVSCTAGIMKLVGDSLKPVKSIWKKEASAPRLYSIGKQLWCFGGHQLICFDGEKWKNFDCPDNLL